MKKSLLFSLFLTTALSFAQVTLPYYEGFNYPVTADPDPLTLLVSPSGNLGPWLSTFTTNTNGDPFMVASPFWSGLPNQLALSQTGEAIQFQGGSDDPVIPIPDQGSSGLIYSSFIFKVTDQSLVTDTNGGFIYSFGKVNSGNNGYNYCSAVYLRKTSETTFNVGVSETNSTSVAAWSPTTFNVNDDVFVVIAYDIANQLSKIWINPNISGVEPAPTVDTSADSSTGSRNNIVVVRLSLESNARTPTTILDEIRIGNTWQSVTGQAPLSVTENELSSKLKIYPNPAKDVISIETDNVKISSVELFTLLGQKVKSQSSLTDNKLSVSDLSKGIYLLKVSAEGSSTTKKIIIE